MALQDNFNAVYNRSEQAKQQKELIKQQDKTLELQLLEDLQLTIEAYITSYDYNNLYFLSTKRKIIDSIIQDNEYYVNKFSKYKDVQNIKNYLNMNYDKVLNKVIRITRRIDAEEIKKRREAEKHLEEIKETRIQSEIRKAYMQQEKENNTKKVLEGFQVVSLFIIAGIIGFLQGFIGGIGKKK